MQIFLKAVLQPKYLKPVVLSPDSSLGKPGRGIFKLFLVLP